MGLPAIACAGLRTLRWDSAARLPRGTVARRQAAARSLGKLDGGNLVGRRCSCLCTT
ncbi:hypothetical protein BD310DRAFT_915450 [Dichomitus squalens]|uniref:Uncharacterized protein n=1 Tax=Dichomitus squalens TaxID=114155 RepID=A0A4Q9QAQ7_9APHY|nr:hypothetical protein BD310DRAFT_915450 [Dichomitus squalens]